MQPPTYEPLSAQDNSFLFLEGPNAPMHVAATQIFRAGPLATPEGGIDIAAVRGVIEAALHRIPRYRQRLAWIPFEDRAVWVDDPHFQLDYHIRHTSLPRPGGDDQLKKLSARILSQPLDRERPLWEMWVIEGLEGGRFATVSKVHHCMVDGSSGMDLATVLLSASPESEPGEVAPFRPRPAPSGARLWWDRARDRLALPLTAFNGLRRFVSRHEDLAGEVASRVKAVAEAAAIAARPPSTTPLDGPLGPHRTFDWLSLSLEEMKAVRRELGGSVNDVVLAVVTGAVRSFLQHRNVRPESVDFRVSTPVNMRTEDERGTSGNRVSSWIVPLPVRERDPLRQLDAIRAETLHRKESRQEVAVDMAMGLAEWTPPRLISLTSQAASPPINSIVTNVPGPQFPLYLLGAELLEMYPMVPLLENLGLGIAVVSYNGRVCWGFNADYDRVPDVSVFAGYVRDAFESLAAAAGLRPTRVCPRVTHAPPRSEIRVPIDVTVSRDSALGIVRQSA